jgi:hypothetical protein
LICEEQFKAARVLLFVGSGRRQWALFFPPVLRRAAPCHAAELLVEVIHAGIPHLRGNFVHFFIAAAQQLLLCKKNTKLLHLKRKK